MICLGHFPTANAEDASEQVRRGRGLENQFQRVVLPFVESHCVGCHGPKKAKAKFDISGYRSMGDVVEGYRHWNLVLEMLTDGEMPPEDEEQPPPELRTAVIDWISAARRHEALMNAGDPGVVLARRLSNAEYDYTIRDLTGVDIRPTRDFPIDPANQAGFDNSGESLVMSPGLFKKYLQAARHIGEYLVLNTRGFAFADHPVMTETDRDRYCVTRIVEFYRKQPVDLAAYLEAAWRFENRAASGFPGKTLEALARGSGVSPKYLRLVHGLLTEPTGEVGPVHDLQTAWGALPAPIESNADAIRQRCEALRDGVLSLRKMTRPTFEWPAAEGIHMGSQAFVLWINHRRAATRNEIDPRLSRVNPDSPGVGDDAGFVIPGSPDQRRAWLASLRRFAEVFPDTFLILERGREYNQKSVKATEGKGRLLSAGFHSMVGYFRDDEPLYDLILNEREQRELDLLWEDLDFIASARSRQYAGMLWFERTDSKYLRDPEFDFARPENKSASDEAMIRKLSERYLDKAVRGGAHGTAVVAIQEYFERINRQIRVVEASRFEAEPGHLEALLGFAGRAWRRPLTPKDKQGLLGFYHRLRQADGLDHEQAIRDSVVSVLISPGFCYRVNGAGAGGGVRPLDGDALANRLSYFLWSSMPDAELMSEAAAGNLRRPEVLVAQARRMLKDDRVRGLAVEFCANWLGVRRFEKHNAVDRDRFPAFDDALRQAMFEEPIRFFMDVAQADRGVGELIYSDYTFLNPVLARHYGVPLETGGDGEWVRTRVSDDHRGGLLPMAVFLTSNSPGLRTSPVKRGYWVARRVLGEEISPPPPGVPDLPEDEAALGDLTLAETLALHRERESCSVCHDRFDSLGLAFENYGPVGEWRTEDMGGRTVNAFGVFPGGGAGEGLAGLRDYIREEREPEFYRTVCEKLLAFGLGRSLILSDEPLIEEMLGALAGGGGRLSLVVESIVASRQFRYQSGAPGASGDH